MSNQPSAMPDSGGRSHHPKFPDIPKSIEERWFSEQAPFRVPAATAAQAPVAITLPETLNNGPEVFVSYRRGPAGYLLHCGQQAWLTSRLDGRTPAEPGADGSAFPFGSLRPRDEGGAGADRLAMRATVLDDKRAEALARATALAERSLLVDGEFWHHAKPPVLAVAAHCYMQPFSTVRYVPFARLPALATPFHVADLDAATEHAAWLSAHPWLHSPGAEVVPPSEAAGLAIPPDRDGFLLDAARHVLGHIAAAGSGPDFASLPIEILDGWVRFRKAASRVAAGEIDAVAPAYGALADIHDRLPDLDPERARDPKRGLDILRRRLEDPVRHWRTYLRHLAPGPTNEDDLGAVGTLAP